MDAHQFTSARENGQSKAFNLDGYYHVGESRRQREQPIDRRAPRCSILSLVGNRGEDLYFERKLSIYLNLSAVRQSVSTENGLPPAVSGPKSEIANTV